MSAAKPSLIFYIDYGEKLTSVAVCVAVHISSEKLQKRVFCAMYYVL